VSHAGLTGRNLPLALEHDEVAFICDTVPLL